MRVCTEKMTDHQYSWFAMRSSKVYIKEFFLTESLQNVNNLALKSLYKFQVHKPINARVGTVQSLENLHTSILQQPC